LRCSCSTATRSRPTSSVFMATAFSATRWLVSSTSLLKACTSRAPARWLRYRSSAPWSSCHLHHRYESVQEGETLSGQLPNRMATRKATGLNVAPVTTYTKSSEKYPSRHIFL
jgi:hypothetical protein